MDTFQEEYNLVKMTQEEIGKLSHTVTTEGIQFLLKSFS